ncbi:hypothetical protein [Microbacterium sp. A93]|uniref:hypothetical protein n=1 Tax=Microbacterium sp. A93 TaxID=3450716 RepID=UPI003F436CB8
MKNRGMVRRPLALTAATTIALGGLFFATPAYAADAADEPTDQTTETTPVEDAPPAEVIEAADDAAAAGIDIVAYGVNAAGDDVVMVVATGNDDAAESDEVKAFTESADIEGAKVVTVDSAPVAYAATDVVGGQGYLSVPDAGGAWACSVGFSAFSPDGAPALISAGHCAFEDGVKITNTTLSVPGQEPAVGGSGAVPDDLILLGTFGFARYGGLNGTIGADGDVNSTDISVIDINPDGEFNLLPEVTDWTTATDDLGSLAGSTIPVKSVGAPVLGDVSKSGRTTGFTTGTIDEYDIIEGWMDIAGHWVRGFQSDVEAAPGDSGGAVIQGTKAVGVISGGIPGVWTWATSIVYGLEHTDGYTVALDLDAPKVTAPTSGSTVDVGSLIAGTAPGAKSVKVSGVGETFNANLENGEFTFLAPTKPGTYEYTLTSTNGFSASETTTYTVTTKFAPTAVPVITSPADGSTVTSTVKAVSGTGLSGAAVVATVDGVEYETTVDGAGNWSVAVELTYGAHTISVVQTANEDTSDAAKAAFKVVPVAVGVTSITNGSTFAFDNGPKSLAGTGINGATVTVKLNGAEPTALAAESGTYTAEVADGVWSINFEAALEPGSYTVSATQSISGIASAPVSLAFSVLVEPVPEPVTPPAPEPTTPPAPGGSGGAGDDGNLAATGSDMIVPLSASAGAVVLLAGGIMLLTMRRRKLIEG